MSSGKDQTHAQESEENVSGLVGKKRERSCAVDASDTKSEVNVSSTAIPKSASDGSRGTTSSFQQNGTPTASPPGKKTLSMEELLDIHNASTNLTLVHEIAFNSQFKLPEKDENKDKEEAELSPREKLEKAVKDAMHRAFWDSLSHDLHADPVVYDHAFVLLAEIKEILLSLLPPDRVTSLHKKIHEGLDIDLLKQQAENDTLDLRSLATFLIDTMASFCAPLRDQDVEELRTIDDIVELFKGVYRVLGLIKRDIANYTISVMRPFIQQQHVAYERKKFEEVMSKFPGGLRSTEGWLKESYEDLKEEQLAIAQAAQKQQTGETSERQPSSTTGTVSPLTVLKKAYIKLLNWDKEREFPETVVVDQGRFLQLEIEFRRILLLASTLLSTLTSLPIDLTSHSTFVTSLKQQLLILMKSEHITKEELPGTLSAVSEQICHKASEYMTTVNPQLSFNEGKKLVLKSRIADLADTNKNPVFKVLGKRAKDYLFSVAEFLAQRTSVASAISVEIPPGLQLVSNELSALAKTYAKLVNLNQTVYGPFYVPILRKILDLTPVPSPSSGNSPRDETASTSGLKGARKKLDLESETSTSEDRIRDL